MNQHYDDSQGAAERALGRTLHEKVDQMNDSPLGMGDVRARAGTVRRNRRIVVGTGLAAAAVIIVPTAIAASDGLDRSDDAPALVTASPTVSEAIEPTPSEAPSATAEPSTEPGASAPFDVSDLPTGAPPAIEWTDGRDVQRVDGTVAGGVLPGGMTSFAPMGSGWMVSTNEDGNGLVRWVSGSGQLAERVNRLDGSLVTSPQGQVVAWTFTNEVYVAQRGGTEVLTMASIDAPGPYSAVAVTSEDCKEGRASDAGCAVFVNTLGQQSQVWISTANGIADRYDEEVQQLTAWTNGLYAGITAFTDDLTTCSAVREPDTLSTVWETCDHRLLAFSPDAGHLLGVGSIGSGLGDGQVAVLDAADGTVLVDLRSDEQHQTTALQLAWEDDEHVLLVTYDGGQWAVVRLGLDGTMEYAVPPRRGSDFERPFYLQS